MSRVLSRRQASSFYLIYVYIYMCVYIFVGACQHHHLEKVSCGLPPFGLQPKTNQRPLTNATRPLAERTHLNHKSHLTRVTARMSCVTLRRASSKSQLSLSNADRGTLLGASDCRRLHPGRPSRAKNQFARSE